MKSILILPALVAPVLASEPNTLSPEEKEQGFELIFDGETTDGWRNYGKDSINDKWQVVDGALKLTAKGGGDVVSEKQYGNFDFRFEFMISPDGNSGVMWHVAETDEPPYKTGPEYQILDSAAKNNYQNEVKSGRIAGAFYDILPGEPGLFRGAGEWNEGRIVIDGPKVTLHLNGEVTAEVDTTTERWEELLADSKFADWPKFNKMESGHLCLQDHSDVVAFRSMRIRELP